MLEASTDGYLIADVDSSFGQHAALRVGAVIIEIGGEMLLGLDTHSLERSFGAHFKDGARVLTVDAAELKLADHPAHRYWKIDATECDPPPRAGFSFASRDDTTVELDISDI